MRNQYGFWITVPWDVSQAPQYNVESVLIVALITFKEQWHDEGWNDNKNLYSKQKFLTFVKHTTNTLLLV